MRVSLTTFVDFSLSIGPSRITHVRDAKAMYTAGYDPARDYWRGLRQGIVDMHKRAMPHEHLVAVGQSQKVRKQSNYFSAASMYITWLEKQSVKGFFEPPDGLWTYEQLQVLINPEVGLVVSGKKVLVKLYFKAEKPTPRRLDETLCLLQQSFPKTDALCGILDVRRGRLFTSESGVPDLMPLVIGDAASFIAMWDSL